MGVGTKANWKWRKQRITRKLVRRYFGSDARIWGVWGSYRVTTPTGGKVVVRPNDITLVTGGDDIYKAFVRLCGAAWGEVTVKGSREFMMGALAHGEAWGVNVRADFRDSKASFRQLVMFIFVVGLGLLLGAGNSDAALLATFAIAAFIWLLMRRQEKRREQQRAEAMGFHYPRVHGSAGAVSHDDAKDQGWV